MAKEESESQVEHKEVVMESTPEQSEHEEVVMESTPEQLVQTVKQDKVDEEVEATKVKKRKKVKAKPLDMLMLLSVFSLCLTLLFSFLASVEYGEMQLSHEKNLQQQAKEHLQANTAIIQQKIKINKNKLINLSLDNTLDASSDAGKEQIQQMVTEVFPEATAEIISLPLDHIKIADNPKYGFAFLDGLQVVLNSRHRIPVSPLEVFKPGSPNQRTAMLRFVGNKTKGTGYFLLVELPKSFIKTIFSSLLPQSGQFVVTQGQVNPFKVYSTGTSTPTHKKVETTLPFSKWVLNYHYPVTEMSLVRDISILFTLYIALAVCTLLFTLLVLGRKLKNFLSARRIKALADESAGINTVLTDEDAMEKLQSANVLADVTQEKANRENNKEYKEIKLEEVAKDIFTEQGVRAKRHLLTDEVMNMLGQYIAHELDSLSLSKICVGFDAREGSEEIAQALITGLLSQDIEVLSLGQTISPVVYFTALKKAQGCGVMVTAGSATKDINGLKILIDEEFFGKSKLKGLLDIDEEVKPVKTDKVAKQIDVLPSYLASLAKIIKSKKSLKLVIDSGNGAAGSIVKKFFTDLACDVTMVCEELDPSFPHHSPDPSKPGNLKMLIEQVKDTHADLGLAFNSDATALGIVSAKGAIIWPDRVLMLLAKDALLRHPKKKVLYDIKSTSTLHDWVIANKGEPELSPSGFIQIKERMVHLGAMLAGEYSGHFFVKEHWTGYDDALYAAAKVVEIIANSDKSSDQVFSEIPEKVSTPEIIIPVQPGQLESIMNKIVVQKDEFDSPAIITLDGLRVEYEDGWGLVRGSNTSNSLSMRFEADSPEALQRIAEKFKEVVLSVVFVKFPF